MRLYAAQNHSVIAEFRFSALSVSKDSSWALCDSRGVSIRFLRSRGRDAERHVPADRHTCFRRLYVRVEIGLQAVMRRDVAFATFPLQAGSHMYDGMAPIAATSNHGQGISYNGSEANSTRSGPKMKSTLAS